jgi:hypothetical protein
MNLSQMLAEHKTGSVSKAQKMVAEHLMSDDESGLTASYGIGSDSFHWGLMDIVPPKDTVPVENPGDEIDKQRRKSKKFRKYEKQLQLNQGGRKALVQTQQRLYGCR